MHILRYKILLFIFLISACSFGTKEPVNTEILCVDLGMKILIHNVSKDDFWNAVENFHALKTKRGSKEDYTPLIFKTGYSMQLKGMKVEDIKEKCLARQVYWSEIKNDYIWK